ncbi:MAG: hypothetical protein HONBIEJF_00769 [Fimbriimonadaceae bacterium]|nr:hypothetical protein [Fimbriimonadaceae bacterium]
MLPGLLITYCFISSLPLPKETVIVDSMQGRPVAVDIFGHMRAIVKAPLPDHPGESGPKMLVRAVDGRWSTKKPIAPAIVEYHAKNEEMQFWPTVFQFPHGAVYEGMRSLLLMRDDGKVEVYDRSGFECTMDQPRGRIILTEVGVVVKVNVLTVSADGFRTERYEFANGAQFRSAGARTGPLVVDHRTMLVLLSRKPRANEGVLPAIVLNHGGRKEDKLDTCICALFDMKSGRVQPLFLLTMPHLTFEESLLMPRRLMTVYGDSQLKLGIASDRFYVVNLDRLQKLWTAARANRLLGERHARNSSGCEQT